MPYFMIQFADADDAGANRDVERGAHIGFRKSLSGIVLSGPLLSDDGSQPTGSLIILEADGRAAAERIARSDPYVTAGVLDLVDIKRLHIAACNPIGS